LDCLGRRPEPHGRNRAGDRHLNFHETRDNLPGGPELLVRSPWLLQRYLTQDGECSPLTAQGALPTGDTGSLADGQLTITGRLKDLIIRGGFNVSPVRIESVIMAEDGVADCAVIGVPDDFWGEVTVACLVAGSNSQPDLVDRVRGRCLRELSGGMRPDRYEFFPRLPRTVTGKVRKNELRALLGLSSQHR
jgi:fatty-acyl-CoA synthase